MGEFKEEVLITKRQRFIESGFFILSVLTAFLLGWFVCLINIMEPITK